MCELKKKLEKYDTNYITKITLCKEEFSEYADTVLNYISFGDYLYKKKKYDFVAHHGSMYVELDHKAIIFIDKQPYVYIEEYHQYIPKQLKIFEITGDDIPKHLTVRKLMENTKLKKSEHFKKYNVFNANCQLFILSILESNDMLKDEHVTFLKDDAMKYLNQIQRYMLHFLCFLVTLKYWKHFVIYT